MREKTAGKTDVPVTVAYAPSQKSVTYHFTHNASVEIIRLSLSGDPQQYTVRLMLPKGKTSAKATVGGMAMASSIEKIEYTSYVVISNIGAGKHEVGVSY